jgi:2-dehydro-3-deoxyphosphooctonate aldolase (KDO 8-P synthase)
MPTEDSGVPPPSSVRVGHWELGSHGKLFLIAGPCVIENLDHALFVADKLSALCEKLGLPYIFKSSYDKANRSSGQSPRGPGMEAGLEILAQVRERTGVPVLSDVHSTTEVGPAAAVLDVIQIPAFLCRQTDLLLAAGRSGRTVNVKKGQFLSPWDMAEVVRKLESTGCRSILLTERGVSFGYNNLVADLRAIPVLQQSGYPVVFDATHSLQLPGGLGSRSGGQREWIDRLSWAAVAAGCDGLFLEMHQDPDRAPCDGPNMLPLADAERVLGTAIAVREAAWGGNRG